MLSRGDHSKDKCSQWLISKQAGSILRLGGITGFTGWTVDEAQLIATRRLPDGLVKVSFADMPEQVPYLLEIESYSNTDADRQVFEDLLLARLDRGVIPEAICVVLCPKGNVRVRGQFTGTSPQGTSSITANWRVVELWTLNASDLLAQNDIGLIPWAPAWNLNKVARAETDSATIARSRVMKFLRLAMLASNGLSPPDSPVLEFQFLQKIRRSLPERLLRVF